MGIPVTMENFCRAETDNYFRTFVKKGALGHFVHDRALADVHDQKVIRMNRDTLYSSAVFDLDAGPVTVTLPDAQGRFMSLLAIDEDHYNPGTLYDAQPHLFSKEQIGTRYLAFLVRTFVDPNDPADLASVHALQDAIRSEQASTGTFQVPDWDQDSLTAVRDTLKTMMGSESHAAFGTREDTDPQEHLVATAVGWGGNPRKDAIYVSASPERNDGKTIYRLRVTDVPVDGFWSISIYNQAGFFEPNPRNAYSLNNVTSKPGADGTYTIQFGGCDDDTPNCLPIMPGWNYVVRLYRPRPEILDGSWKFPSAQPVTATAAAPLAS